jgi:hypothetical protein
MKGVVEWLSPRKARVPSVREVSARGAGKENKLARERRFSLSDDDDEGDVSVASSATTTTLVASTPKKEKEAETETEKDLEAKEGIDLLLDLCSKNEVVAFDEYITGLLDTATITKLGEATYSEVFTLRHHDGTTAVLKVIPFNQGEGDRDTSMSSLQDILQEIRISRAMAKVEGFADFQGYSILRLGLTIVQWWSKVPIQSLSYHRGIPTKAPINPKTIVPRNSLAPKHSA